MAVGQVPGYEADRLKGAKSKMDHALNRTAGGSKDESIYVMRHGKTALDVLKRSDGWLDFPLSDDGRLCCLPALQYLKDIPTSIVCIYSSSLKRALETAELIQSGVGTEPEIMESDKARTWNTGKALAGSNKKQARPLVEYYLSHPDKTPEDGESINTFRKRFLGWLHEQMDETRYGPILLILSGSNIREISEHVAGARNTLDLDEGGLMELKPSGAKWSGTVIMGSKNDSGNEPSAYGS